MLSVKDYNEFIKFVKKLINNDIRMSMFFEPDINEYTSVTIEPGEKSRKLTSNFPLMLKQHKETDDYISKKIHQLKKEQKNKL